MLPNVSGMDKSLLVELRCKSDHFLTVLQVQPRFAYLILVANLLVYGIGLSRLFTEGPEGPTDYFLSLAEVDSAIEGGEYFRSSPWLHCCLQCNDG